MHSKYKNIARSFHYDCNENNNDSKGKYKIDSFDDPNGWSFREVEHLYEMGFTMDDDYTFSTKVEKIDITDGDDTVNVDVYKTNDGYVLQTTRKYIFKTFDKMMNFLETAISDFKF